MKKTGILTFLVMVVFLTTGFVSIGKQAGAEEPGDVMVYSIDADNPFTAYGNTDGKYASVKRSKTICCF